MAMYHDDADFETVTGSDGRRVRILRDGGHVRTPMHMRDSQGPMITDGTGAPLGLHRPGWRIASGGSEHDVLLRDSQRKLVEEAHAEYLDHLTNAWKGNPPTDSRR